MKSLSPAVPVAFLALAPGISASQLRFEEVAGPSGLGFSLQVAADHHGGPMGGGGSVGDFDRDGWPDVFVPSMGVDPDRLLWNQQDGTFLEVGAQWGLGEVHRGCGSAVGDYDGDGWLDVFVTSSGPVPGLPLPGQNRLYRNTGQGSFVEVGAAAGVAHSGVYADGWSATFGDVDLDGDLDLFTCAWKGVSEGNRLFRNEGDGTFRDVTHEAGVFVPWLQGFSARIVDIERDRWPDLLVAGDFGSTHAFQNTGHGFFRDATGRLTPDLVHNGMGHAVADFQGDGWLDWFVTSIYEAPPGNNGGDPNGNRLYRFDPVAEQFVAEPFASGVVDGGWGWGTVSGDFDHDGDVDLAETNGWILPEWQNEASYLYLNDGDGTSFTESARGCGFVHTDQGRGLVTLDHDRDGDLDLLVFSNGGATRLYRNELTGPDTHFLRVELDTSAHPGLAPDGYGTRVEADVTIGGVAKTLVTWVDGGSTFLGNSEASAHFGLGDATRVDELRVLWADGFRTVRRDVAADQLLGLAATPPLAQTALAVGQWFDSSVRGLAPGETAVFLYSAAGTGPGPCFADYGGLCLDLLRPVHVLGTAVADTAGVATVTALMPPQAAGSSLSTQAAVPRPPHGARSVKTNVITSVVLP